MRKTLQLFAVAVFRSLFLTALFATGMLLFQEFEDVTLSQASHFVWSLTTTTGDGFYYPLTDNGKIFTICYGIIAIPVTFFTIASYAAINTYILKKIICGIERLVCRRSQFTNIHIKLFSVLLFCVFVEVFVWGYVLSLLENQKVIDGIYVWFATVTTTGFGDILSSNPTHENYYLHFWINILMHILTLSTIGSLIQAIQGMTESIDNSNRSTCAKLCCCYQNERKEVYEVQVEGNCNIALHYIKE